MHTHLLHLEDDETVNLDNAEFFLPFFHPLEGVISKIKILSLVLFCRPLINITNMFSFCFIPSTVLVVLYFYCRGCG